MGNPRVSKGPWTPEVRPRARVRCRWRACVSKKRLHTTTPHPRAHPQEDAEVIRLVAIHGAKRWSVIADNLQGRVGKQCRER